MRPRNSTVNVPSSSSGFSFFRQKDKGQNPLGPDLSFCWVAPVLISQQLLWLLSNLIRSSAPCLTVPRAVIIEGIW